MALLILLKFADDLISQVCLKLICNQQQGKQNVTCSANTNPLVAVSSDSQVKSWKF